MEGVKGCGESGVMGDGGRWADGFHTVVRQELYSAVSSAVCWILQKLEERTLQQRNDYNEEQLGLSSLA